MSELLPFRCPACGFVRQVAPALAGRLERCPECREFVEIAVESSAGPSGPLPASASAAANREQPAERPVPAIPPPPPLDYVDKTSAEDFDPYYRWLAIAKSEQPPNHYRLLGVRLFERDADVILNSSERQMAHVKAQAGGRNIVICQRLLSELSLARICLLDETKKAAYDAELRAKLKPKSATEKKAAPKQAPQALPAVSAPAKDRPGSSPTRPARFDEGPSVSQYPVATPDAETAQPGITPPHEPVAPPVQGRWKGTPVAEEVGSDQPAPPPPPPAEEEEEQVETVVFKRNPVEGEIDMTPMIDVTFLLLIFFICTASFVMQMTKEIPAPKEDEPSTNAQTVEELEDDPDNITVRIDSHNTFRVITPETDDEAPSYQELLLKLRAAKQGGANGKTPTTLMVIVNAQARHETQVMALDAGTEVGMEKMLLMSVESDDE